MMLVIHRCDKNNTGDLATDPLQYWNIPHHTLDLNDTTISLVPISKHIPINK